MKEINPEKKAAQKIAKKLINKGFEAYFVGGSVRDELMQRKPKDYDVVTNARPYQIKRLFKKAVLVGEKFGVVKVLFEGYLIDVVTYRSESGYSDRRRPDNVRFADLKEDLKRRDFTINALIQHPLTGEIIDYFGGKQDIKNRIIRCIGDPKERLDEDRLRILRAVRFASTLGFDIEERTKQAILNRGKMGVVDYVSMERIRDELIRMLCDRGAPRALELLKQLSLLDEILPEVSRMSGTLQPKNYHPEGDVFEHTKKILSLVEDSFLKDTAFVFGCLLHDVAKPVTMRVREDGKITFYGHCELGAKMTTNIMKRLKFSNREIEKASYLVLNHLRFKDALNMRKSKFKRFISEKYFQALFELYRYDTLASHGDLEEYYKIQKRIEDENREEIPKQRLITGYDLIELGFKPGPIFKTILTEVEDRQLEGIIKNRDDAIRYVKERFIENK